MSLPASFRRALPWQRSLAKSDGFSVVPRSPVLSKASPTRSLKPFSPSSGGDGDGREIGNFILRAIPRKERAPILSSAEFVRLKLHQVLHEPGEAIKSVYFLNNGLGSVLTTQPDGKTVEVGLIGREGFVGLPIIFGFKTSGLRVVTQGDATAYRVEAKFLLSILPESRELEKQLQRFSMMLAMQSTQLAACNRLHDVVARLARWLLMSQDRIASTTLPLTQDFLAQMLGTRRASVTVAAGVLQKAATIEYSRGSVRILDRPQLEAAACDCYQVIERQKKIWQAEVD
jgi:CRP-like cAMP-binding protein